MILRGVQLRLTGLPAWQSGQPGQVGNQAALTVESVPGSRLVNLNKFFRNPFSQLIPRNWRCSYS